MQTGMQGLSPMGTAMGLDPYAAQLAAYAQADAYGAGAGTYGSAFGGIMGGQDQFGQGEGAKKALQKSL